MKNKKNEWLKKKSLIGPFIRIPRPEIVEILAIAGFDFAVVDLEHGSIMPNEVYPMILAAERHGMRLIARVPGLQENYIKWLLDLGIGGLQIPHIKTADDAKKAIEFSKFHPTGSRGLCRFVRAAEFSNINKEQYIAETNQKNIIILQIEGKEGVDNIEEIAKVPGIDILFIGPYDLSQSLGVTGQIWHKEVINRIEHVLDVCNKKKLATGVFTDTLEGISKWHAKGIKYLNYRIEVELLLSYAKTQLSEIRQITNF